MLKKIIDILPDVLRDNVIAMVCRISSAIENIFSYLTEKQKKKDEKEKTEKINKINNNIEKACDKGNLNDLLDAISNKNSMKTIIIIASIFIAGCQTIEISAVKSWEGRYSNKNDAVKTLEQIKLDKGESIWILSNSTLKRILTTDKEK